MLDCVRSIPPGKVMTYGDVAEFVGWRGPRWVGRVLAESGDSDADAGGGADTRPLPWHRVVPATGLCAQHIRTEQMDRLRADATPLRGDRVDLPRARWDGQGHRRAGSRGGHGGYGGPMTDPSESGADHRADTRADLLPEERAAGKADNAHHQAEIILADSDRRTEQPEETKHESVQTPERDAHAQ